MKKTILSSLKSKLKSKSKSNKSTVMPIKEYTEFFLDIKNKVQDAQMSAVVAASQELIKL